MNFHDDNIPKKLEKKIKEVQDRIFPEIVPLLEFVVFERARILSEYENQVESALNTFGIEEVIFWNGNRMHVQVPVFGTVKVERDPISNEWIIFKITDFELSQKIRSFIEIIFKENRDCVHKLRESCEAKGLVFEECYEGTIDYYLKMEYKSDIVCGEVIIPVTPLEPPVFCFREKFERGSS